MMLHKLNRGDVVEIIAEETDEHYAEVIRARIADDAVAEDFYFWDAVEPFSPHSGDCSGDLYLHQGQWYADSDVHEPVRVVMIAQHGTGAF